MFSPLIGVVWVAGLVQLLRRPEWRRARLPALVFLVVLLVVPRHRRQGVLPGRRDRAAGRGRLHWVARAGHAPAGRVGAGARAVGRSGLARTGPGAARATYADSFYRELNDDQPETIGWPEYADQVRAVVADLPDGAVVFTGNYGEAGAFEWYGVGAPVYSGHNGWRNWGPPPDGAGPVVVVVYSDPGVDFTGCQRAATLRQRRRHRQRGAGPRCLDLRRPDRLVVSALAGLSHYDA